MDTANPPKTKRPRPDRRPLRTATRRGLAVVGACLLIGVCVLCARRGWADRVAADATIRLTALQEASARTGAAVAAGEARALAAALELAQRFEPGNPTTAEQLGGLYSLNVREAEAGAALGSQRARALEQYAMAVALRPTSPYAWANLAWTKYYLGQVDAEFYRALEAAMRLGPWEPEVQFVVVDLGLALWDEMPAALRPGILAMAQNGQRRYPSQIVAIAGKRGRLAEVCNFEKLAKMAVCKAISG